MVTNLDSNQKQSYLPFLVLYDLHNIDLGLDFILPFILDFPYPCKLHFHDFDVHCWIGVDLCAICNACHTMVYVVTLLPTMIPL
jgi:hypothetical protein